MHCLTEKNPRILHLLTATVLVHLLLNPARGFASRQDLFANSDPGIRIHVREIRAAKGQTCDPILLVHGARAPGVASFDLPVPGGSLATDLADRGFFVYVMDVRGYGQSTRPPKCKKRRKSMSQSCAQWRHFATLMLRWT
jgi:alpha-beta hydrolase superfamily lysophospholipase